MVEKLQGMTDGELAAAINASREEYGKVQGKLTELVTEQRKRRQLRGGAVSVAEVEGMDQEQYERARAGGAIQ